MAQGKDPSPQKWEVDRFIKKLQKRADQEEEAELAATRDEIGEFVAGIEELMGAELDEKARVMKCGSQYKIETIAKMRRDGWELLYDGSKDMKINPMPFTEQMIFEVSDGTKLVFKRAVNRKELK